MNRIINKIIFAIKYLYDSFFPIQRDFNLDSAVALGNHGASFTIGRRFDSDSIVYSFGVGFDISFDLALIEKYGLTVYAFDPTPGSVAWLKKQKLPRQFIFSDIGVADYDGQAEFFPPENPDHISHTMISGMKNKKESLFMKVESLSTIMQRLDHKEIDLLKMDIEGAEYKVIDDLIKDKLPIRQIAVEFHHRFREFGILKTRQYVKKLRNAGYKLFYVSLSGEELSFIKDEQ